MNSQSPITMGWPPPGIENAHLTLSLETSEARNPGFAWNLVDSSSGPSAGQSDAPALIGPFNAHTGSAPAAPNFRPRKLFGHWCHDAGGQCADDIRRRAKSQFRARRCALDGRVVAHFAAGI